MEPSNSYTNAKTLKLGVYLCVTHPDVMNLAYWYCKGCGHRSADMPTLIAERAGRRHECADQ